MNLSLSVSKVLTNLEIIPEDEISCITFKVLAVTILSTLLKLSSPPGVFLRKGNLKICSNFTEEDLCRRVISLVFFSKFAAYSQNTFT